MEVLETFFARLCIVQFNLSHEMSTIQRNRCDWKPKTAANRVLEELTLLWPVYDIVTKPVIAYVFRPILRLPLVLTADLQMYIVWMVNLVSVHFSFVLYPIRMFALFIEDL